MAVQKHAPVDILTSAGDRVFPYGHCVLFESLPKPQTVHLADRSFTVAPGIPPGRNRDYPSMGLAVLLVFCDMDGLPRDMDCGWGFGRLSNKTQ